MLLAQEGVEMIAVSETEADHEPGGRQRSLLHQARLF